MLVKFSLEFINTDMIFSLNSILARQKNTFSINKIGKKYFFKNQRERIVYKNEFDRETHGPELIASKSKNMKIRVNISFT